MASTESKGKRSYWPLVYLVLYLINIALIVVFQAAVTHVYDRPITKASLEALPYFSGCAVLDLSGEQDTRGPGYVLYTDPEGTPYIAELDYMLFLDKFRIDQKSVRQISNTESDEIEYTRLSGGTTIHIDHGEIFQSGWGDDGGTDILDYVYTAMILLLVEGAILLVLEKIRKKR